MRVSVGTGLLLRRECRLYHGFALDPTVALALATVADSATERAALAAVAAHAACDAFAASHRVLVTGLLVRIQRVRKRLVVHVPVVVGV